MIRVEKYSVDTEGTIDEIGTELACAIIGVFDAVNDLDEDLASKIVRAAIATAAKEIKDEYNVTFFENASQDHVINIQVKKEPKEGTSIADALKEVEHYRKAKQGADTNAKPTE